MKPKKILYENQDKVLEKASKYLIELIRNEPCVKKAFIWASLAEGKFGVYEKEYSGRFLSDIDLVIILEEAAEIPKN